MSGMKDQLYRPISEASRFGGKVGDEIGWDWLKEESDKNTKNPGRAVGKAAGYTAGFYLGGLLGGALGGAGGASAEGGGAVAGEGLTSLTQGAGGGLQQSMWSSLMPGQGGAGEGLLSKTAGEMAGGGAKGAMQRFAMQQGLQMMQPRQPPPMQSGRPMQSQQQGPLTNPYGQGGNSLGIPSGMTLEEYMKRKQMGLI